MFFILSIMAVVILFLGILLYHSINDARNLLNVVKNKEVKIAEMTMAIIEKENIIHNLKKSCKQ